MRIELRNRKKHQEGALMIPYFILLVIVASAIASLGAFVSQTGNITDRRNNMIAAIQYAEGGAVVACSDLSKAFTNKLGNTSAALLTNGYALNSSLGNSSNKVYLRTISSPFTNQTVAAQIWLPNVSNPKTAKIVATATSGKVTQTATVNVKMSWAFPGTIISTSSGSNKNLLDKPTAQDGNVVVTSAGLGTLIVDGGPTKAILANGTVNIDTVDVKIPTSAISATNYGTANEIPDYTAQGTANALFDFDRFTAIADLTTNALNPVTHNNHFTSFTNFQAAMNAAWSKPAKALEGMIMVDIKKNDPDITIAMFPNGINVKGTLFFNFDSSYGPLDKVKNEAALNVNPANLSGLVATNPATYTSGYPPVYYDPTKNPTNINITSKGFENVTAEEDLPAVVYSIGMFDMHGNCNVSGVVYTPSTFEIENSIAGVNGQLQYFKGTLIMGLGCYIQNNQKSTTIFSYDPKAIDSLATVGNAGKAVIVAYWQ